MQHTKYFVIGGGMAADAAVKAIRKIDANGAIVVTSAESHPPYKRPPLTKGLWKGKREDSIWLHTEELGITLNLDSIVESIDPLEKSLVDDKGEVYSFEKLLLATGGMPRHLPFGSERVVYYRTFYDYKYVREVAEYGNEFVVIGGGFIGSEIAAALAMNGKRVTMLFPENGIGAKVYPKEISTFLVEYYREKGVEIFAGDVPNAIDDKGERMLVMTQAGREIEADGVIAGLGIVPNTELAQQAGLPVDNGIVVDDCLRAGHPDIYSAGDVARFYNPTLDKRLRVEHEDNAVTMGGYAGRNMAGEADVYDYLPYFYSDLFEVGYEAVGDLDVSNNEIVCDWKDQFKEGVIYYLNEGRVRGVMLWNVWKKVPEARELIAQPGPFTEKDLIGRITAK